jgi:peptidoglycan hydrolase CwlO-like protein
MTRRLTAVGLLAALILLIGGPGLSVPEGSAEMMQADKAMMTATGEDLMALKKEIAAIQADLERLTTRAGAMTTTLEKTTSSYCKSVPDPFLTHVAPGLCK